MNAPRLERLGFIELAPGVQRHHVLAYLFAAFVSIGLFTYLTTLTPYVFRVILGIPAQQHGQLQGSLQFAQEIILLAVIGFWGAMSDRWGRRPVYVAGFLIVALSYALYPFADSTNTLVGYRLIYGVGIAAISAMLATLIADYPAESSRGKLADVSFFLNGVGSVLFFVVLARLPVWYQLEGGIAAGDPLWAGRYPFLTVAAIAILAAVVMLGLKPGRPDAVAPHVPLVSLVREGCMAARNPRIALSYASSVAARGDMAIITLFLQLWAIYLGIEKGMTAADATAKAGAMVVGISQGTAVLWSLVFGWAADRLDRLTLMVIAFMLATAGYGWIGLLPDVLAPSAIPALILLGIGQSSAILATTLLLAREAPTAIRGSVFGVQSFCGAVAILIISVVGGHVFDTVSPAAPFWIMTATNGVLLLWSLAMRIGSAPWR